MKKILLSLIFISVIAVPASFCVERTTDLMKQASGAIVTDSQMQSAKDGTQFIEDFHKTTDALDNYSFNFEMTANKGNNTVKEQGKFLFKKPRQMRIEITSGPKKGSVAILGKDGKVRGHLGGPLSFFKATLSPDSDMLRSANGYPMVDSDFASLTAYLKNMLKKGNAGAVTPKPVTVQGIPSAVHILDMYQDGSKQLLLKRIFINPNTNLPVQWHDFVDGKLLSVSKWDNIKTNLQLTDEQLND
jgi:hypothetical protein